MESLFDPERRKLAVEYNQRQDRYQIYQLLIKLVFWLLFFTLSWDRAIYRLTARIGFFELQVALLVVGFYFIYSLVTGIADYQFSYKLAREYNLSNQLPLDWIIDRVKIFLLTSCLVYIIGRSFLLFVNQFGRLWWLPFTGGGIILILLINFLFPVIIFPLFFELSPYPQNDLRQRLVELVKQVGLPIDDIYQFDLSSKLNSANAAVMGLGQTRKIILGDNLEADYTPAEIEAVLAHEIGHQAEGDIFKLLFVESCSLAISTGLLAYIWPTVVDFAAYPPSSPVALPLFLVCWGLISRLLTPIELIVNRHLERQADQFALDLIDQPCSLATAFARLADQSLSRLDFSWYELLFEASHPSIRERVQTALARSED